MTVITWIFLGLVAGFIGSRIMSDSRGSVFVDIVLGVIGALVGGFLFQLVGYRGVTGFDPWSVFVAVVGSVIVLAAYHAVARRRNVRA
jgi:uncharacterized membrane protein YeaQ/YmgE (transglycosylase-associated protein family)